MSKPKQNTAGNLAVEISDHVSDFLKKMDDIRILKETIAYKKAITSSGYEWIVYPSEELFKQAKAMAMIMNFETKEKDFTNESGFVLGIRW